MRACVCSAAETCSHSNQPIKSSITDLTRPILMLTLGLFDAHPFKATPCGQHILYFSEARHAPKCSTHATASPQHLPSSSLPWQQLPPCLLTISYPAMRTDHLTAEPKHGVVSHLYKRTASIQSNKTKSTLRLGLRFRLGRGGLEAFRPGFLPHRARRRRDKYSSIRVGIPLRRRTAGTRSLPRNSGAVHKRHQGINASVGQQTRAWGRGQEYGSTCQRSLQRESSLLL